jgi:hypothetical protein
MREQWAPFHGYEVSDHGRVRNGEGKILRLQRTGKGYLRVELAIQGGARKWNVHRIVMLAFRGPPEAGQEVNHRNGQKHDNRLENLEYVTPAENSRHAVATGLRRKIRFRRKR